MSAHPKRRGQRCIPEVTRLEALDLAAHGVAPRDIAERLGVPRGTVRCWLSRARQPQRPAPATPAELEALADQVDAGIAQVNRRLRERDPHALLDAASVLSDAVDALLEVDW